MDILDENDLLKVEEPTLSIRFVTINILHHII